MAGLFAWAADVVAGNGNTAEREDEEEEERGRFRFSPQQEDRVRHLDSRAAALQRSIQHLRQRIPPPDISRSLPQLHSDSLSAHAALTMELNAHQATKREAETREAALHAENAAYSKAVESVRQQVRDKVLERSSHESRLQEMETLESNLREELARLQNILLEKMQANLDIQEGNNKQHTLNMSLGDKALMEGEELQKARAELKSWEHKLSRLEQEWATLLQSSARWPSVAQREKELERKLRSVSEQLMIKQTQIDALTNERKTLVRKLNDANEVRRKLLAGNGGMDMKGSNMTFAMSSGSSFAPKVHSQAVFPVRQGSLADVFRNLANLWGFIESCSRQTGSQFRSLRALIVAYILSLHILVFVIISLLS